MKRESWLPAVPQSAPLARAIVRDAAAEYGLDGETTWDLMLATSEAVANAVLHGQGCADNASIRLRIRATGEGLFVEVCDCGRFGGRRAPATKESLGGRGIPLMSAVTDDFELLPETGGTRVRFGKRGVAAAAA